MGQSCWPYLEPIPFRGTNDCRLGGIGLMYTAWMLVVFLEDTCVIS